VLGAGRSGTTVFGMALGNARNCFYAGELDAWTQWRGKPAEGDGADAARLWAEVRERMRGWHCAFGPVWCYYFEYPRSLLRIGSRRRRALRPVYAALNADLYDVLRTVTGCDTIVDSSHHPLRCRELSRVADIDLFTVHYVRDPRSVVASLRTGPDPQTLLSANLYLWVSAFLSSLVYMTLPRQRRMRLRHEDFVSDPTRYLAQVSTWMGQDLSEINPQQLVTGTPFAANRLRLRPTVAVSQDTTRPASCSSRTTLVSQLPWILQHGYMRFRDVPQVFRQAGHGHGMHNAGR
jgi:hypothetical protein